MIILVAFIVGLIAGGFAAFVLALCVAAATRDRLVERGGYIDFTYSTKGGTREHQEPEETLGAGDVTPAPPFRVIEGGKD